MQVTLRRFTPDPEQAIIEDAAVCWKSTPREQILHHIIKAGHWTPLESVQFNFLIEGVSRSLTHQLVRKRVGVAFCQESQRYVKYLFGLECVTPPSILNCNQELTYCGKNAHQIFEKAMRSVEAAYEQLLELGIPGEDARFVLPNACNVTITMAINYHSLVDLCKERMCSRAQWEIREMVGLLKAEVEKVSPVLAQYLQPKCFWLKHCPEAKPCGRWKEFEKNVHSSTNE
jgi:thymidylate synthase (FAD)